MGYFGKLAGERMMTEIDPDLNGGYIGGMISMGSRLAPRLLTALAALVFSSSVMQGADYFPPPDSEGGWRTLKDAKEIRDKAGMDLPKLEQAFDFTQRCSQNGGLLVVRHGYLVFEKYYGRAHRNANPDMASTGKAFTSIACGVMLNEFRDKIPQGLDTKVFTEKYLPEAFPLDDPRKAEISLGQLLCMSAGYWGEGGAPTGVVMGKPQSLKPVPGQNIKDLDQSSLKVPLWTNPGGGYSYSSPAPHIASIVLRHVTGMELQDYINERLAKPMGWGPWGYCLQRGDFKMPHANGAGSTALHATDALRFGYCLLRNGKWKDKQLVPAEYIALCNKPAKYNPHTPFTLQFEHNADGHVAGAPRDAYYKSGAGGFGIFVVPSLDIVIYKLGGKDNQYDPALTGLPQPFNYDGSRNDWQPIPRTPFHEGSMGGDDGLRRVLEMVAAAVRD
jgi:CubicO group peptidase (beta-lactamase class C family)